MKDLRCIIHNTYILYLLIVSMQTVTISKKEYDRLKRLEKNSDIASQVHESIDDIKNNCIIWS